MIRRRGCRRWPGWWIVVLGALVCGVPSGAQPPSIEAVDEVVDGAAAEPAAEASATVVAADRQLLDDIFERQGMTATRSKPGFGAYLQDVGSAVGRTVASWLSVRLGGLSGTTSQLIGYIAYALLAILAVFVLILIGRALWRYYGRPRSGDEELRDLRPAAQSAADGVAWDSVLQEAVQAGDVSRAIEALWWWLAETLGCHADGSWTSRELVQRAGRRDLLPQVRRLDRLLFSPQVPAMGDVEGLWHDLQQLAPHAASQQISTETQGAP